jgi:hypothetical protein
VSFLVCNYDPRNVRLPDWVTDFIAAVQAAEAAISTAHPQLGLTSDAVVQHLAPGLRAIGFAVEAGKTAGGKIRRPVLFGENGRPAVSYEIDAFYDQHGIVVEVEAGRGARDNATYRDIVRTSLILDACYLAVLLPVTYRHLSSGREVSVAAFRDSRDQFDAIFASQRLRLPFDGVLLRGY